MVKSLLKGTVNTVNTVPLLSVRIKEDLPKTSVNTVPLLPLG